MFKITDATKLVSAPEFAPTRDAACGLAVFIATLIALGILAGLAAGLDLHTLFTLDQTSPASAELGTAGLR